MTIAQLESDLRAKRAQVAGLIETTAHTCRTAIVTPATATTPAVVGRLMNAEEKAAIDAILKEAEAIQQRIDGTREDAELLARVDRLRGGGLSVPDPRLTGAADRRTIGQQFTQDAAVQTFLRGGGHRHAGSWTSPQVECFDPLMMHATTLTEDPASAGKLLVPQYLPGVLPLMFRRLVVADLMASGTATSNSIVYMIEKTFTNAAAPVAEGGTKPESALVFDQTTDPVSKIAHWLPVTEELLEDVAAITSYIDARLRLGVQLAEEDQLLNGNGTAPNLRGVLNRVGLAASIARNSGATPPETNMDAILRQITAIATSAFVYPDGIVINPANWFTCQVSKDTNGQYYGGGPFSPLPVASMWGTPVAPTPSMVAGTALVGAFGTMSQVFRKGGINVAASNSHQDFFIKNLVAIRAEERLALAVYRPGAFGTVTGLN